MAKNDYKSDGNSESWRKEFERYIRQRKYDNCRIESRIHKVKTAYKRDKRNLGDDDEE